MTLLYGAGHRTMGMPDVFAMVPVEITGGVVPGYYLLMIGTLLAVAALL